VGRGLWEKKLKKGALGVGSGSNLMHRVFVRDTLWWGSRIRVADVDEGVMLLVGMTTKWGSSSGRKANGTVD
jgi:hypothetical protein